MSSFDRNDTSVKVIDIVAEKLSLDKLNIVEKSTLQDLGADSLDSFEIIVKLQDTFGIEIDDDSADSFSDIQNVVNYVHEKRKK
ncbi:acyl carrier protein [bacterium]|nr:acyl carrier protein [bacterium]